MYVNREIQKIELPTRYRFLYEGVLVWGKGLPDMFEAKSLWINKNVVEVYKNLSKTKNIPVNWISTIK